MSAARDPFDVLVALRADLDRSPAQPGDDARLDARFRRACRTAVAPAAARGSIWSRWRRRIVGGGLAIGVISGGAIAAAVVTRDGSDPQAVVTVGCRAGSDEATTHVVPIGGGDASPFDACAALWSDGTFGTSGPPPWVLCQDDHTGFRSVVPGSDDDVCARIGLVPATVPATPPPIAALHDELVERLMIPLGEGCFDTGATQRLVDELLAEPQFEGWSSSVERPTSADQPCGLVIVPNDGHVLIVARPLPPESQTTGPSPGR